MKMYIKKMLAGAAVALAMLGASLSPASAQSEPVSQSTSVENTTPERDSSPDVLTIILAILAFTTWGSLPYMVWVLLQEKKRRYEPVAIPEGSAACAHDVSLLDPACEEALAWTTALEKREVEGFEGPQPVITSRREVDNGYNIIARLKEHKDELNAESLYFMNAMGDDLNNASKRYRNGSVLGMVIACVVYTLVFALPCFLNGHYLLTLLWISPALIYCMSLWAPAYKMANPAPAYYRFCIILVKAVSFGTLFTASEMAQGKYAPVYRDRETGKLFQLHSDREDGCFFSAMVMAIFFVLSVFIFLFKGIVEFFRNYVGNK